MFSSVFNVKKVTHLCVCAVQGLKNAFAQVPEMSAQ